MRNKKQNIYLTGTLRVHPRGFGFLVPDDRAQSSEDVFIPKSKTRGAVDGDKVEIELSPHPQSERGPEGRVHKVIERGRTRVGGTVLAMHPKKGGDAYAPLLGQDETIQLLPAKAKVGDRVLIEMLHWGTRNKMPLGEVVQTFGHIDDASCDVEAALAEYSIDASFPKEVVKEAKQFGDAVKKSDEKGRKDLTKLETITIDPATAKDFDDALSLSKKGNHYDLTVHIADVSHYVRSGSKLDKEAKKRCNSVYFPGSVVPMLPHELSSHLCSLMPDVKRLAVSVHMIFSESGEVLEYEIFRSVIRSDKRFSYEDAKLVLDGKKKSPFKKTLELMVELCHLLKKHRAARGSIEFALPDLAIGVNKKGEPEKLELVEYDITHQLVEEFMLKANEIVATHLAEKGKPLTYRIHEEPLEDNIQEFAALAKALGFKVEEQPDNEALQDLFDQARSSPFGKFLATSFIRSMKLASYSTQNVGHYGLCLDHYTHFTSPIRRYIDLVVHRVLFGDKSTEQELDAIATHCSEKERLSAKAEQSVTLLKKLRYLKAIIDDDPDHRFKGVITKVKPQGFAFEVNECLLEGFIPMRGMRFDEKRLQLKGKHTYRTGDSIHVTLDEIDLITLETRWSLCYGKRRD